MRLIALVFVLITSIHAQNTHEFRKITHNTHFGGVKNIAHHPSGDLILIYSDGRVRGYDYSVSMFTPLYVFDTEIYNLLDIDISDSGIVFMSGMYSGGVKAYSYVNRQFSQIAELPVGNAYYIAVLNDSTIISHDTNGISAYTIYDSTFNLLSERNIEGNIRDIAIGQNGIIFISAGQQLHSYILEGDQFLQLDIIDLNAFDLCVSQDGVVYLWRGTDLDAYNYVDSTFCLLATVRVENFWGEVIDMSTGPQGKVYLLNDYNGVGVFQYTDSTINYVDLIESVDPYLSHISKISIDSQNTVFHANLFHGISAYQQSDTGYVFTAKSNDGGVALNISTSNDSTVFLANGEGGLRAYELVDNVLSGEAVVEEGEYSTDVVVNSQGMIYSSNGYGNLSAYSYLNHSFSLLSQTQIDGGGAKIALINDSTIVTGYEMDGVSIFIYRDSGLTRAAQYYNSDRQIWDIAATPEGIFYVQVSGRLEAYYFDGVTIQLLAEAETIGGIGTVGVRHDGIIFVTANYLLRALEFDGTSFSQLAEISCNDDLESQGVVFGNDGTIFLADSYGGLKAFVLEDTTLIQTAHEAANGAAFSVFTFDGSNIWVAQGSKGMSLYSYNSESPVESLNSLESPTACSLKQNYPNPFNPSTTLRYGIPEDSNVSLVIYDVRGQVVQTLESGNHSAGWYDVVWNGYTSDGKTISTGIYFARLVAGDYSQVIKMLYLK